MAAGAEGKDVTAWAQPRFGALSYAGAPAKEWGTPKRRPAVQWSEPEPWIVAVLLLTGVAVVGRHPIARVLGTEVDENTIAPTVVATGAPAPAPAATSSTSAAAAAAAVAAVPTHAPRDPFHALVKASNSVASAPAQAPAQIIAPPATLTPIGQSGKTVTAPKTPKATPPETTSCTGTTYTVQAGDSLWSIAAGTVKSGSTAKINVVWHRIYDDNRAAIGSDPSLLRAGTQLCMPGH
jgi:nucleoid-associated protein YgaU